jgi:hypothetical protein
LGVKRNYSIDPEMQRRAIESICIGQFYGFTFIVVGWNLMLIARLLLNYYFSKRDPLFVEHPIVDCNMSPLNNISSFA